MSQLELWILWEGKSEVGELETFEHQECLTGGLRWNVEAKPLIVSSSS